VCFVSFVVKKFITTKSTKVTKFLNPRAKGTKIAFLIDA